MNKELVIVTGHKGFIGTHLTKALENEGYEVKGIDLKTGGDIRTISVGFFKGAKYVFHLAAQTKVPLSIESPQFTNDHNINGTLNVLVCARDAGVKRVIYSSSSSLYAGHTELPWRETMEPKPMSPYGIQKLVGEMYCRVFSALYGLETVCLRYFNVFGEGMDASNPYSAVVAKFMQNKLDGKPSELFGGDQTRDMTYVGDVVRANILASKSEKVGRGEGINIGSGKNFKIKELAELIGGEIIYKDYRSGEAMGSLADISGAKALFDWEPTVYVDEWLKTQKL